MVFMPARKGKVYTTITLPQKDYDRLVSFKKELEKRDDFSYVAALGLGAFIGFMIGFASDAAKHPFFACTCGRRIDLTQWRGGEFMCPNCRRKYPQPASGASQRTG